MTFSIDAFIRQAYRRSEYNRYMQSETWAAIRDAKMACTGNRCETCGNGPLQDNPLQAHHLTYARFGGNELMTDLRVLCKQCHENAHGRKF